MMASQGGWGSAVDPPRCWQPCPPTQTHHSTPSPKCSIGPQNRPTIGNKRPLRFLGTVVAGGGGGGKKQLWQRLAVGFSCDSFRLRLPPPGRVESIDRESAADMAFAFFAHSVSPRNRTPRKTRERERGVLRETHGPKERERESSKPCKGWAPRTWSRTRVVLALDKP